MLPLNACYSFPVAVEDLSVCLPSSTCSSAASYLGTFTPCPIRLGTGDLLCVGSTGIKPKLTLRLALYLGKSYSKTDYTCRKGKRFRGSTYRLLHHTVPSWSSRRYLQIYMFVGGGKWQSLWVSLMSREVCLAAMLVFDSEVLRLSGAGCF